EQNLPITIIPGLTVREPDGLAMSSRNRFLSPEDRQRSLALSRALIAANQHKTPNAAEHAMHGILTDAGAKIDYAVIRESASLLPPAAGTRHHRALIAARIGSVRLIDNAAWSPA